MNSVQVIEKNEGTKIEWEQNGTKLYFDDEIMINVSKYRKDWDVSVDICRDRSGNLTLGAENALRYVAQVDIPAITYEEDEEHNKVALPLDMSDVVLTLWSVE